MLKLRIHSTGNEQKPLNGNLQKAFLWVTCYLLFLASLLLGTFFFNKKIFNKKKKGKKDTGIVTEQDVI